MFKNLVLKTIKCDAILFPLQDLFLQKISPSSSLTIFDVLKMLQAIMASNNLTYVAVIEIVKLINELFGGKKLPESEYYFKKICTENMQYTKHFFCKECKLIEPCLDPKNCSKCNSTSIQYFVTTPIRNYLHKIISKNFDKIFAYRDYLKNLEPDVISDVNNGIWYRSLSVDGDFLTININTDGVAPFNASKKKSLWPILITINDLEPSERFKKQNIIPAGYWMCDIQPILELFLLPCIEELNDLFENGIVVNKKKFKVIVCCMCLDSVARAKCLNIKQYNGNYGCTFCLHPVVEKRFPIMDVDIRTLDHFLLCIQKWNDLSPTDKQKGVAIYGVKGRTEFLRLKNFNPTTQVPVDFMHCVLLGVMKTLLNLWLDPINHNERFYINTNKKKTLDFRFANIKTYSECTRKSVSLLEYKTFKASELFNFMFYYSKYCLSGLILEANYYQHFIALLDCMEILYGGSFSIQELDSIKHKLHIFVRDFETLYGKKSMYYNVHLLLHIVDAARLFGPLFTTSLFPFENMNGVLNRFLNGPKGPQVQICVRHYLFFGNYYSKTTNISSQALEFCKAIINKTKRYKFGNINRKFIIYNLPSHISNIYNTTTTFKSYVKYFFKHFVISTEEYSKNNKNFDDSYIYFDTNFIKIVAILKNCNENDECLYILGRLIAVNTFTWIQNYYEIINFNQIQLIKIDKDFYKCIHYTSDQTQCLIVIKNVLIVD